MKIIQKDNNQIIIELDNTNMISITEVDSDTVQLENITTTGNARDELGFLIEPVGIGSFYVTPEG